MEVFVITSFIALIVGISLLTSAGIILIIKGLKTNQSQLIILGIADSMVGVIWVLIGLLIIWPLYPIINILTLIEFILISVAIKKIFYRGRSSPLAYVVSIISILYGIVIFISFSIHFFNLLAVSFWTRLIIYNLVEICNLIVHGWFFIAGYKSYKILRSKNVNPEVTKKIKLTTISTIFSICIQIPDLFRLDPDIPYIDPENPFTIILLITQISFVVMGAIIFFIAWVPPYIKSLSNHFEQMSEDNDFNLISEEEIEKQLQGGNWEG